MISYHLNGDDVAQIMATAHLTEMLMHVGRTRPAGYETSMPDILKVWNDVYSKGELIEQLHEWLDKPDRPTGKQIDQLEMVWEWRSWLDEKDRKIVVMRSGRTTWKVICRVLKVSRQTAHRKFLSSCIRIADRHNKETRERVRQIEAV